MRLESAPPPEGDGVFIPIASPRPGALIRGVILHDALWGQWVHWDGKRNEPCWGEHCPERLHGYPRRWKGYVGVRLLGPARLAIAELTVEAVRANPALLPAGGASLRGLLLTMSRQGRAANGAVRAVVEEKPFGGRHDAPPPFRLVPALLRVWYGGDESLWPHWIPDEHRSVPRSALDDPPITPLS